MANQSAPWIIFGVYGILMLATLICFVIWIIEGDVKDEENAIILVILMGIGFVASNILMWRYRLFLPSLIAYLLASFSMVIVNIVSHMETEEKVSAGGMTYTKYVISKPGLAGIIFGYVAIGIGGVAYYLCHDALDSTGTRSCISVEMMDVTTKGRF